MNAVNPIDELKEAKRLQQALKRDPSDIDSQLKVAAKLNNPELKRKMLNRILTLEPTHQKAREMLLEMDRAEMGENPSLEEPREKLLVLSYSIVHQIIVFALMAISFAFCLAAIHDPQALLVFGVFFLLLIIPLWFVSAVVEVSHSGISISRLFGISKQGIAWGEIVTIKPNMMGQGLKLSSEEGSSLKISSQLHGYPALVEILRKIRPDLFSLAGNSSLEDASSRTGAKAFQKSFPVKYGALFLLIPASLLFLGAVFTALFLPAILIGIFLFFFWRMTLFAPYMVSVEENRLFTQSFLKKQNLTAQQIKNIRLISLRNRHGVAKNFIQIEPLGGKAFRLSKFPEGNEMMYGFLKNWWGAYQAE